MYHSLVSVFLPVFSVILSESLVFVIEPAIPTLRCWVVLLLWTFDSVVHILRLFPIFKPVVVLVIEPASEFIWIHPTFAAKLAIPVCEKTSFPLKKIPCMWFCCQAIHSFFISIMFYFLWWMFQYSILDWIILQMIWENGVNILLFELAVKRYTMPGYMLLLTGKSGLVTEAASEGIWYETIITISSHFTPQQNTQAYSVI